KAAYLMAVGGAAYLVSKAIRAARVVAFADLGMEAIYEFEVKGMPVTVAVDAGGESVHDTGPRKWQQQIRKIPVATAEPLRNHGQRTLAPRRRNDFAPQRAAAAHGAADQAQPACHRPHRRYGVWCRCVPHQSAAP